MAKSNIGFIPLFLRKSNLFVLGLLALALPVTIFLTQQIQDTRQGAAGKSDVVNFKKAVMLTENGNPNDYIRILNPDQSILDTSFTVETWFNKTQNTQPQGGQPILVDMDNLLIVLIEGSDPAKSRIVVQTGGGGNLEFINGPEVNNNEWHHVAVTYNETLNGRGIMTLHVDGQNYSNNDIAGPGIGSKTYWGLGANIYEGLIDEYRVVGTVAYSQSEDTYSQPKFPFTPDENTVVLLQFNGSFQDETGNHQVETGTNFTFENSINPSEYRRNANSR